MKKEQLRLACRIALERRHGLATLTKSQGVIPGARLGYVEHGLQKEAAVRTSSDGEVGLLRNAEGAWRTLDKVDLVLVGAPDPDQKRVKIFAFDPKVLADEFDRAVEFLEDGNEDARRFKTPIFLPLIGPRKGLAQRKGLSALRLWEDEVKKVDLPTTPHPANTSQALDMLRAGLARGLGVHPNRIELEFTFRIKDARKEAFDEEQSGQVTPRNSAAKSLDKDSA